MTSSAPRRLPLLVLLTLAVVAAALAVGGARASGAGEPAVASSFDFVKYPSPAPACTGVGLRRSPYLTRDDCGFGDVTLAGLPDSADVQARLTGADGSQLGDVLPAASRGDGVWRFEIRPGADWPAGPVTVTMIVAGRDAEGTGTFFVNQLGADVSPEDGIYAPGDEIPVTGEIFEQRSVATSTQKTGVPATFKLRVVDADGHVTGTTDELTAAGDGAIDATLPGALTAGLEPARAANYRETVRIELVDAGYDDPTAGGAWAADGDPAGTATVTATPAEPVLENSFVSSVGWVKPGEAYPFTVRVKNFQPSPVTGARVTIAAPDGTTVANPTWDAGSIPAATEDGPGVAEHVFEAKADAPRPGPADRLEGPLEPRRRSPTTAATAGRVAQPRPEGDPAVGRLRDLPLRRPPVPGGAGRLRRPQPRARRRTAGKLAGKINDPGEPRLDVQPLPGDVLRAAVPERHRALRRASPPPAGTTSTASRSRRTPATPTRAAASPTRRCPATPTSSCSPSASRTAGTSCPARPTTTATTPTARP